ncbi:MAG: MOSC domain-containing protein [Armatimonadota bacterium]|nr:MOSC domain-containing protein [Armatimonadota bacterium]MDR7440185.1 MOSC domain-containing protein [Armatimonadota bacterium]MDR7563627.1 MOSC domain-containing protein [Armatimonadota bacterium]MDR7567331.1 MOSC domain-containing protein [Armatimonadota bacterium]
MRDLLEALEQRPFGRIGRVTHLVVSPRPGDHRLVEALELLPGVGPVGEYAAKQFWKGRRVPGREVSAVNAEFLELLGIAPEVPGDNLIVQGIRLCGLSPGTLLRAGVVRLRRTATPHRPCALFRSRTGELAFELALLGWRGALFEVLDRGVVRVGDPVEVLE